MHALSGVYKDVVEYVKAHPNQFDKKFFKDHIATNYYALMFEVNDFEYMPLEYIDEEMVACAMFKSISARYTDRRGDFQEWFYSVKRRKPEVLCKELYILGARCFATKRGGTNEFLKITPMEYRTTEYYFAMCIDNDSSIMDDIPESILTDEFLVELINDNAKNIKCFNEAALERVVPMSGGGKVKCWQAAVILDGYVIREIPLNEERIEFFLSMYPKNSCEYEYGFKEHYKAYLRKKKCALPPANDAIELASKMTYAGAKLGIGMDSAVMIGNCMINAATNRQAMLPIFSNERVPDEYSKKYDKEEYLIEIYKKLGIQVVEEADYYYYSVILPEEISVNEDESGYAIMNSDGEVLIHYYDRGPFYDRSVKVDKINVTL